MRAERDVTPEVEQERPAKPHGPGDEAVAIVTAPPVRVGAAADPAEHAADELAARALARMVPAGLPSDGDGPVTLHRSSGSGHALAGEFDADPAIASRLHSRLGKGQGLPSGIRRSMEQGFGASFSSVRVHHDPEASRLADSLGAEAFTHGKDIFFGASRFQPDSLDGQALIAHELAHVVQEGGPVRRKLKGTHAALVDMGGKAGLKMKLSGSDYPKILSKVSDYEKREEKVLAKKAFGKGDKAWMVKTINEIIALIDGWVSRHEPYSDPAERKARSKDLMYAGDDYNAAMESKDTDTLSKLEQDAAGSQEEQRVRTLQMLKPRLAAERYEVNGPAEDYFKTKALMDKSLDTKSGWNQNDAVGGAANRLDKVEYQGGKQGFFIADKSNVMNLPDAAMKSEIDRLDPNQGGRSVASSRLAKLFGSKLITNVEFATHSTDTNVKGRKHAEQKTRMGVVSEKAEGTEAGKLTVARGKQERAEYEKTKDASTVIDMDDPELQRSLNILQMLDYISLQLDRHAGNFYIATDEKGKVLGVTGIDLDISFGKGGNGGKVGEGGHFVGIPELADAEFRAKVLSVSEKEIRDCLDGVIDKSEIDATVERFTYLCKRLKEMDPKQIVQVGGWGAETAKQQGNETSYLGKLKQTTVQHEYDNKLAPILKPLESLTFEYHAVKTPVQRMVDGGELTVGQGLGLIEAIVHTVMSDPTLVQKRQMMQDAKDYESRVQKAVKALADQKQALLAEGGPGSEDRMTRLEAQMMSADLEKQVAPVLADAARKEYSDAVDLLVKSLSDFAKRLGNRQKRAMAPVRRPAKV